MENYSNKKNCSCDKCAKRNHVEKHEKDEHRCNGCVCDQLRCLQSGTLVFIVGSGVPSPLLTFISFNEKTCCATFTFILEGTTLITAVVDCERIDAIAFPTILPTPAP